MTNYEKLYDYVRNIEIIDTHEHLNCREENRNQNSDVLSEYLSHYMSTDLISSGLSYEHLAELKNPEADIEKRFELASPFWDKCRFTGYGRSLTNSVRLIYGIDEIKQDTIKELDIRFKKARQDGNHYKKVLREISNIKIGILDDITDPIGSPIDEEYFVGATRLDGFIMPDEQRIKRLEESIGGAIRDFSDYKMAVKMFIDSLAKDGNLILKCGLAYQRSLHFPMTDTKDAEEEFNALFRYKVFPIQGTHCTYNLQNYMMHFILKCAEKNGMVYQFHTGHLESNGNIISNSDPTLMSNLFLQYPDLRFDLFHISYPYSREVGAIAKMFPNVFLDMCWAHIISPNVCIDILGEWLDLLPYNKISAFGGDYCFVDGVAGHQLMARQNVSKTLAKKVDDEIFDVDVAKHIAQCLFYKNPEYIFKLK